MNKRKVIMTNFYQMKKRVRLEMKNKNLAQNKPNQYKRLY